MAEVLMSKLLMTIGIAVSLGAVAVSPAGATAMLDSRGSLSSIIGSNTASVAGSTGSNLPASVIGVTGTTVTCPDTTYTVTQLSTLHAKVDPAFGPDLQCVYHVSGTPVGRATIHTLGAALTLTEIHSSWFGGLASDITADITGPIVVTSDLGCTLTIPSQANRGGGTSIQAQNVDSAGVNSTSASPWGSKITANSVTLTYTATGSCPGIAEHGGDSFFTGSVYVKNVWGSL
jgi:hypothetical protein